MRWITVVLAVALLIPVASAPCPAQKAPPLTPGARVRIKTEIWPHPALRGNKWLVGSVVSLNADTLVLKTEFDSRLAIYFQEIEGRKYLVLNTGSRGPLVTPLAAVPSFEVSQGKGKNNARRNAGIGLFVGASMGAIWGFATIHEEGESSNLFGALLGAGLFSIPGAAVGALVGAQNSGERWNPAPLPIRVSVSPQRRGGIRLAASFTF